MPNTVYISHVIDAPIEKVWSIMRDFNDMPSYHPGIKKSIIEGDGPSDQVGCVRRLTLGEGYVRERLLCMDDANYVFTYEIIEGTLPVRGYVAGVRLHRVTNGNRTFAEWWAEFDCAPDREGQLARDIGQGVFQAAFDSLKNLVRR
jgi:hypothetical protein